MRRRRVALVADLSCGVARQWVAGVRDYTRRNDNWVLSLQSPARTGDSTSSLPGHASAEGVITGVSPTSTVSVPTVVVNRESIDCGAQSILPDPVAIGRLAAETLRATGVSRIVDLASSPEDAIGEALRVHLAETGMQTVAAPYFRALRLDDTAATENGLLSDCLSMLSRPIALFARTARQAARLLEVAANANLRVPQDGVYLLCAEHDELLQDFTEPRCTAIDTNARKTGYQAAAELDRLLHGGEVGPPIFVSIAGVVAGESLPSASQLDPVVRTAIEQMSARLIDPLSVPDLAAAVGVSRRTLELRFKQVLDSSPATELRRLRVEHACRLLRETDRPVAEIAMSCGFTAIELLQRAMQKWVGTTPKAYRQAHRDRAATTS